jgi:hypothetical protein
MLRAEMNSYWSVSFQIKHHLSDISSSQIFFSSFIHRIFFSLSSFIHRIFSSLLSLFLFLYSTNISSLVILKTFIKWKNSFVNDLNIKNANSKMLIKYIIYLLNDTITHSLTLMIIIYETLFKSILLAFRLSTSFSWKN